MIPLSHRYTLRNEPRYHGWEIQQWDEAAGVLHLQSAMHPGRLCLDMEDGGVLISAGDTAAANLLAEEYNVAPGEAYRCTLATWLTTLQECAEKIQHPTDPGDEITETAAQVKARRKQQIYREKQLALWNNRCALTGCAVQALLVASHAKPWAACTSAERLDPYNGFPLEARFDKLFDQGFISFDDTGRILLSSELDAGTVEILNLNTGLELRQKLRGRHLPYLSYHREKVFRP